VNVRVRTLLGRSAFAGSGSSCPTAVILLPGRSRPLSGGKPSIISRLFARGVPLAAVSRCSELSYQTGQWSIRGLRPKSKTASGYPNIAHDAPVEMPDRSRAEPLHLRAAGSTSRCGAGAR
jgi:hypothetical protein